MLRRTEDARYRIFFSQETYLVMTFTLVLILYYIGCQLRYLIFYLAVAFSHK